MPTFHGTVPPHEVPFRTGPDGIERFEPFNTYYATVIPSAEPCDGPYAVELVLHEGEFFEVREDIDKSEGRSGTKSAGNFLHYPDAYKAARGKGAQGSTASIVIKSRHGVTETTARSKYGATVVLSIDTVWRTIDIHRRVTFPYRSGAGAK